MGRVAAICLDAAEWWWLESLMASGQAPNLARLRDRSAVVPMETPMAYRTELPWARYLSGREPIEEQDWAAASVFHPEDYSLTKNAATAATPFFALGAGTKVVALDQIHSRPAEGVDGVQVVAWGSHSPQWARTSVPTGLLTEIDRRFGVNPAFGNEFGYGWYDEPYLEALGAAATVGAERRFEIARWLLDEHPDWDLFLTCVSEFHTIEHQMWHGVDETHPLCGTSWADAARRIAERTAQELDSSIGRMLDVLPADASVLVFAMHGMQPADDVISTLLMPELFHRLHVGNGRGLLRDPDQDAWRRDGMPPLVPEVGEDWGEYITDRFADGPKQHVRRALRHRLSRERFNKVRRLAGKRMLVPQAALANVTGPEITEVTPDVLEPYYRGIDFEVVVWYQRHWSKMPYFALPTFGDGHIRINLAGRERDGLIAPGDYRRTCEEAIAVLRACRNPRTGDSVVEDVLWLRDEDPFDPDGPDADLLVVFRQAPDALEHPDVGLIGPFPHLRSSQHSPNAFCLLSGEGIVPGPRAPRPTVDLTPTVLDLLGQDTTACRGTSFADLARQPQ